MLVVGFPDSPLMRIAAVSYTHLKETMIDVSVWDQYRGELVSGQEVWGVVELG